MTDNCRFSQKINLLMYPCIALFIFAICQDEPITCLTIMSIRNNQSLILVNTLNYSTSTSTKGNVN